MIHVLSKLQAILSDILDIDKKLITPNSYLIRELDAESIDLLEIAVVLNSEFNIEIIDETIFLKRLRHFIEDASENNKNTFERLMKEYPYFSEKRINEIINDLDDGPALKVKDLISYIEFKLNKNIPVNTIQ